MTKNSSNNSNQEEAKMPAHSNPRSPQEEVMNFIETLGEHLEDALSVVTSHTEKGETSTAGANANERNIPDPPDYWEENDEPAKSENGEKSSDAGGSTPHGRHHGQHHHPHGRRGCRRGGEGGGPWGRDWRQAAEQWFGQGFPQGQGFPHGPGFGRGGHRGGPFGGGRGGMWHGGPPQFGGPWGWGRQRRNNDFNLGDQQFTPPVDVFDTPENFTVHVALAGALKSDIGINYDFETSELQISGVIHRPGDEEFLKFLVSGERQVGVFETKVKLQDQNLQTPAVDADAITAKLENGLLEVVVPKVKKDESEKKRKINIL